MLMHSLASCATPSATVEAWSAVLVQPLEPRYWLISRCCHSSQHAPFAQVVLQVWHGNGYRLFYIVCANNFDIVCADKGVDVVVVVDDVVAAAVVASVCLYVCVIWAGCRHWIRVDRGSVPDEPFPCH
ncbi:hypothetical protein K504DRAFT_4483 [Pleomassaria siparia CBS 279.74]|uniref:Uncharacterized protein n=1 Tax=Pleomassaria siparia CBS 279.74 TaxID=1314801 RepID=A0A6G1KP94_9PLEO|nr:hypothetical protein K504DRAFT_4483 [Pleomassaria siparia CBS 279.74]